MNSINLFAMLITLVGPQAKQPAGGADHGLKLKAGDQIVAIGDSITQAGGYLRVMDAVLAQQFPDLKIPKIINVGISGQKAEDLVKRFEKDVVSKKPAVCTLSIGINDVWHRVKEPPDEKVLTAYAENLDKMVKMARQADIQILLVAPTVIEEDPQAEGNVRLVKYVEAGKRVARENKCAYVDLHALFLKAIEAKSKAQTQPAPATDAANKPAPHDFTSDGVHMKPTGDTLMAIGILRALGVTDEQMKDTDLTKVFSKK